MHQKIEWPEHLAPEMTRLAFNWKRQRNNGRVTAADRKADEGRAEGVADFARQIAEVEQVPLVDRIPEYVPS